MNYDESEDEEELDLKQEGFSTHPWSAVLPVDQDDDIDLCSDELAEILADGPISHAKNLKSNMAEKVAVAKGDVDVEDAGGVFELNDWV